MYDNNDDLWVFMEPWGQRAGRKQQRKIKPLNRANLLQILVKCPTLGEVIKEDIRQVGFVTNFEGNEVTKVLFYSEFVKQSVLRAERDLEKEGIRLVLDNELGIEGNNVWSFGTLTYHAGLCPGQVQFDALGVEYRRIYPDRKQGGLKVKIVNAAHGPMLSNRFDLLAESPNSWGGVI